MNQQLLTLTGKPMTERVGFFYFLALLVTAATLWMVPDSAFYYDKKIAAVLVLAYSAFFYLFAEKDFATSIPQSKRLVLLAATGLLLCAVSLHTILSSTFSPLFLGKLLLMMLGPIGLVLLTKSSAKKFHPLDFLVFLLIFLPIETRSLSLQLVYQKDILRFDTVFTTFVLLTMLLFLVYRRIDAGFTWHVSLRSWLETFGFTVLLITLEFILGFATGWLTLTHGEIDLKRTLIIALFMFFHGSLIEEFFFRGLIFNYFMQFNATYGFWINILINTLIFGATHYNNGGFPVVILASVAGFFFCLVYYRTRNIFCSTFVHAVINTIWRTVFS